MVWKVPLSDVSMGEEEIRAATAVLASGWLSMGPVTEAFERVFADYLGVKYAFAVSSGTAALHLAHLAVGVGQGDEVVVPSLTFVATANAALYCGATPVFADIAGPDDLNLSADTITPALSRATRAITVVHYGGYPCDMAPILEVAEELGLAVIEDAAHAVGALYDGKQCGTMGDVGCFSFFANKNLPTGEGGMIVTDNEAYAERIRVMRSHGMTTLTWDRHRGHARAYDVVDLGYNYRIGEIASALGIVGLGNLDRANARRGTIVRGYRRRLQEMAGLSSPFERAVGRSASHIFPVLLPPEIPREGVAAAMQEMGVQTSVHYHPVHLFSYYRRRFGGKRGVLPVTEDVGEREITLPLYPGMDDSTADYVMDALAAAVRRR
jgi:dTDP-4-amino-4,6-dideoxygalactose transaminase